MRAFLHSFYYILSLKGEMRTIKKVPAVDLQVKLMTAGFCTIPSQQKICLQIFLNPFSHLACPRPKFHPKRFNLCLQKLQSSHQWSWSENSWHMTSSAFDLFLVSVSQSLFLVSHASPDHLNLNQSEAVQNGSWLPVSTNVL